MTVEQAKQWRQNMLTQYTVGDILTNDYLLKSIRYTFIESDEILEESRCQLGNF